MGHKQTRRSVSISAQHFVTAKGMAESQGLSMSAFITQLIENAASKQGVDIVGRDEAVAKVLATSDNATLRSTDSGADHALPATQCSEDASRTTAAEQASDDMGAQATDNAESGPSDLRPTAVGTSEESSALAPSPATVAVTEVRALHSEGSLDFDDEDAPSAQPQAEIAAMARALSAATQRPTRTRTALLGDAVAPNSDAETGQSFVNSQHFSF